MLHVRIAGNDISWKLLIVAVSAAGAQQAGRYDDAEMAPEEARLVTLVHIPPHACSGDSWKILRFDVLGCQKAKLSW